MEVIQQLIGRLHPIVVHLPIGFIIAGLLLQCYDRKTREWPKIISILFLWGFISATIACISGYLLYLGEGYSFDTVKYHLWLGIATAVFSLLMYLRLAVPNRIDFLNRFPVVIFSFFLLLLISFTGHLGGSITHGQDYLTEPLPNSIKTILGFGPEVYEMPTLDEDKWQEAILYTDLVQPILNTRCVSCHNSKKRKGELQLEGINGILKGGKDGAVIKVNDLENSPLYARLILPLEHEDHMPPKDKNQLSNEEIEIIRAWILNANSFDKSIAGLGLKKELFTAFFPKTFEDGYPDVIVPAVSKDSISVLKRKGLHIEPISEGNNFLRVSCINTPAFGDTDLKLLSSVQKQTVYLDLGATQITDAIFETLSLFTNLTVLKLDNTAITGKNIDKLKKLEHLKILNLVNSDFKEENLSVLSSFMQLQTIYLYNTPLEYNTTEKKTGETHYNFGDYKLPLRASDSIVY